MRDFVLNLCIGIVAALVVISMMHASNLEDDRRDIEALQTAVAQRSEP